MEKHGQFFEKKWVFGLVKIISTLLHKHVNQICYSHNSHWYALLLDPSVNFPMQTGAHRSLEYCILKWYPTWITNLCYQSFVSVFTNFLLCMSETKAVCYCLCGLWAVQLVGAVEFDYSTTSLHRNGEKAL